MQAVEVADDAVTLVQGLFNGMDNYFLKESRELKKSCKKEIVGEIKTAANKLNDSLVELNAIREQLQEATGHVWLKRPVSNTILCWHKKEREH